MIRPYHSLVAEFEVRLSTAVDGTTQSLDASLAGSLREPKNAGSLRGGW